MSINIEMTALAQTTTDVEAADRLAYKGQQAIISCLNLRDELTAASWGGLSAQSKISMKKTAQFIIENAELLSEAKLSPEIRQEIKNTLAHAYLALTHVEARKGIKGFLATLFGWESTTATKIRAAIRTVLGPNSDALARITTPDFHNTVVVPYWNSNGAAAI